MASCGCNSTDQMGAQVVSAKQHTRAWQALRRGQLTPDVEVCYPVAVHCARQLAARRNITVPEAFRALASAAKQPDAPLQMRLVFTPLPPVQALSTLADHTMAGIGVTAPKGTLVAAAIVAGAVGLASLVASSA